MKTSAKAQVLREQAQTCKAAAEAAAKTARQLIEGGGTLNATQQGEYRKAFDEAIRQRDMMKSLSKAADDQELLDSISNADLVDEFDDPDGVGGAPLAKGVGSRWAKSVSQTLAKTAQHSGVKSLLVGQVRTPSVVEVAELPANPTKVLDLIPTEALFTNEYDYLRQTVRDENVAAVPDGEVKPTSIYTFEEVSGKASVIAHLSEPFPLRYLTDHTSLNQVLDSQMVAGVLRELEREVIAGTGTNDELPGILTTTGTVQIPFKGDLLTTIRSARTNMEMRAEQPTAWLFNPEDIESLELIRENGATGAYLLNTTVADMLFGAGTVRLPSMHVPKGQALFGDFRQTRLLVREDAATLAATQAGDLFDKNQVKLRSEGRFGFKLFRPSAFALVDLTA